MDTIKIINGLKRKYQTIYKGVINIPNDNENKKSFKIKADKQDELDLIDKGVNDTPSFSIENKDFNEYIDKLSGTPKERRYQALRYSDRYFNNFGHEKEVYSHRSVFSQYHLRIGDCCFIIPPEYISVKEQSSTQKIPSIRKQSSMKKKYGYSSVDITFDLYFNGDDQINGFKTESPFDFSYYVDGLRPFLAQCRVSPILPVENEYLNQTCGIYCVAIQSVTVSTVPNFPKLLKATVCLTECNHSVYTMCPIYSFSELIEWDLFKYNYQRLLNNEKYSCVPKSMKLKAVEDFSIDSSLSISVIDDEAYSKPEVDTINIDGSMDIKSAKYIKLLDSKEDNFQIQQVNFGLSNIIVNAQLSGHTKPATQYLGGNDTVLSIQISTLNKETASKFKSLITKTQAIIRKLKQCSGIGFMKIENSFLNMLGTNYLLVDSITETTVPNFPGMVLINLECVNFDITSMDSEKIKGFNPFPDDRKGTKDDCVKQNIKGLYNKIVQETFAEYKLSHMNLYPDLMLPTFKEIDEAVIKINEFRSKKSLPKLPYAKYPRHLVKDHLLGAPFIIDTYVEPDFYFVYPMMKFEENKTPIDDIVLSKEIKPAIINHTYTVTSSANGSQNNDGTPVGGDPIKTTNESTSCDELGIKATGINKRYLDFLFSKVGCGYLLGAIGEVMSESTISSLRWAGGRVNRKWMGKEIYDCSGIIGWAMYKCGYYKNLKEGRIYHLDIYNKHCTKISKSELQPGDVAFNGHHVVTYIGDGKTVEAANPDKGVIIGQLSWGKYTMFGRIKWPNSLLNSNSQSTVNTNYLSSGGSSSGSSSITIGRYGDNRDRYDNLIDAKCKKYNLSPNWIKALMTQESGMNPNSINSVPAVGLLQITRWPCEEFGLSFSVETYKDPDKNVDLCCRYLEKFKPMFKNDYLDLCCAYNMGPYGFREYQNGKRKLPRETQIHREKCQKYYNQLISSGGTTGEYTGGGGVNDTNDYNGSGGGLFGGLFTKTKEITKKHGSRHSTYSKKLGYPLTAYSPVNALMQEHRLLGAYDKLSDEIEKYHKDKGQNEMIQQIIKEELENGKDFSKTYKNSWNTTISVNDLNDPVKYGELLKDLTDVKNDYYLSTMTVNDTQYNKRGTMLKAFPTYCILISDGASDWLDGQKLWNNYYPYKSLVDVSIFHEEEQPVGTAKVSVTNISQNLIKNPPREVFKHSIDKDKEYSWINRALYKHFGFILGTAKVTQDMIDARNELVTAMKLRPGTRIHIRLGYGSNPMSLNTLFNGTIAEVTTGEVLEMVAQSDGVELINNVITAKENKTNGLFKLQKEPANMITSLLIDRSSWTNMISSRWGEENDYGIENFGLFLGNNLPSFREKEYDLCKNIYQGVYSKRLFCANDTIFDGEENLEMFLYNKTPWDVSQTVSNCIPEFICQPRYHQFDTRLFFGLPTWLYKYRYDLTVHGEVIEQAKTFQQFHLIDGDDILDNKLKVTNKFLYTNVTCMYTLGSDMRSTPVLYADKYIHSGKQKTKVIDTILQQDFFGPDLLYEFLGIDNGKTNAISTGVTNLIDLFGKMYYDDIVTLGKPGINPCDLVFLNDQYAELYGMVNVRAVTHSFSPSTGFTSTISPSLIAYSKVQDSGSTNVFRTTGSFGDILSNVLNTRKSVVETLNILSPAMYAPIMKNNKEVLDYFVKSVNTLSPFTNKKWMKEALKICQNKPNNKTYLEKELNSTFFKNLIAGVVSPFLYWQSQIYRLPFLAPIVDIFRYTNCIGIRPLISGHYPFVAGTKGQKKLIDGVDDGPYLEANDE